MFDNVTGEAPLSCSHPICGFLKPDGEATSTDVKEVRSSAGHLSNVTEQKYFD